MPDDGLANCLRISHFTGGLMAIFKSTFLSDVRGSLAGSTFSRTRAGNIMRVRTQPVQPNTPAQTDQRANMTQAVDAFRSLSQAQVDAWAEGISGSGFTVQNALGDTYVPSAKQVVTAIKLNFLSAGSVNAPELSKFLSDPNLPDVNSLVGPIVITTGVEPLPDTLTSFELEVGSSHANTIVVVAVTPPLTASIRNYKKYLRNLQTETGGSIPTPAVIDLAAAYNLRFPGLDWGDLTGNVIGLAVKVVDSDTGLASAWFMLGTVAIPAPTP